MTRDPDFELLERWRAGDRRAGHQLFTRHFDAIRRYFLNAVDDDEREDLVQETFRRVVSSIDKFKGLSTFKTYLYSIARYVLMDFFRKRYSEKGRRFDPLTHSVDDPGGVSPSHMVTSIERHRLVLVCMRKLPVETKQMLELYYWHGLTGAELAEFLGVEERTVRSRIYAARQRLIKMLQRETGAGDDHDLGSLDDQLSALGEFFASGPLGAGEGGASSS